MSARSSFPRTRRWAVLLLIAVLLLGLEPALLISVGTGDSFARAAQTAADATGAGAKKCEFRKTATRWTLTADCETTKTIEIPNGVTLDGRNRTISLVVGPNHEFGPGIFGILAHEGHANVINVKVDGSRLGNECAGGIRFDDTSGRIAHVHVMNFACDYGGIGGNLNLLSRLQTVDIVDSTVENLGMHCEQCSSTGISLGGVAGTISGNTVRGVRVGIFLTEVRSQTVVKGNRISASAIGIDAGFAQIRAIEVSNNRVTNPIKSKWAYAGIVLKGKGAGSIHGNAVSGFFNPSPDFVACGISTSGNVTIGTNTFPPPGNEQDVCDNTS